MTTWQYAVRLASAIERKLDVRVVPTRYSAGRFNVFGFQLDDGQTRAYGQGWIEAKGTQNAAIHIFKDIQTCIEPSKKPQRKPRSDD